MNTQKRVLNIILGPALFGIVTLLLSGLFGTGGAQAIGVLIWMIFWWITRPVHMTVTALVPIMMNALLNIIPMGVVTSQYFSDSIILILGSCLLTLPWKSTGLDRRIALKALSIIGPSMKSQITVWLLVSMVMSVALPNVAVCALLTPIAVAMLHAAGNEDISKSKSAIPILLAIGWGVGLGGVGSPLGGAMNVAAISFMDEFTGREFMYIDWILRIAPFFVIIAVVMLVTMLMMHRGAEPLQGTKEYFDRSYAELGPIKKEEKICATLFILAMVGAFARPLFADLVPALVPAYVFLMLGSLAFFINIKSKGLLLTWEAAQEGTMWGMMLLFGGGLALGKLVNESGASAGIAQVVSNMNMDGGFLTVVIIVVFATLISETTSSTVSAAVTIPIVLAFTSQNGLNPIPYWFIAIMAYNSEFLLPISVRAIPVGYGLSPSAMMKRGIPMMLIKMVVVIAVGYACMQLWPMFSNIPYLFN
ncbi:MAG: SLC13 family permease [Angelakisella sp.]